MTPRKPLLMSLVSLALIVAACGSPSTDAAVTTSTLASITTLSPTASSTTTSTAPVTTTTATPAVVVYDTVNGLEASDESMNRRAVVIKIDNHSNARPQSGVMEADLMYEMLVEGGLTRFAAVFHQTDTAYVGPVRSGRPTDVGVVRALDAPYLASGAQPWVKDIFEAAGLKMVWDTGAATFRKSHRSAPHNLFASTYLLRAVADDRNWSDANPGNVFQFGEATMSSSPATEIALDWSNHPDVRWVWNGEAYDRFNGDDPHMWVDESGSGGQVSAPIVVVIVGRKHLSSPPNGKGSSVPTTDTIGSGEAYVFARGTVIEGAWSREHYDAPIDLTTADGTDLILSPSRLWIAFFPDNRELSWK